MKTNYPKYRIAAAIAPAFSHLVLFFKLLNRVMPAIGHAFQFWLAVITFMVLIGIAGDNGRLPTAQWNYSLMILAVLLMLAQYPTVTSYMGNPDDKQETVNAFFFWMTFAYLIIGLIATLAGPYAVIGLIAAWLLLTLPVLGVIGLFVLVYKWIERLREPKDAAS